MPRPSNIRIGTLLLLASACAVFWEFNVALRAFSEVRTLAEIVGSIKSVADIVGDIAAASTEQATGIEQVNKALAQMDEVTQQNSALVEENAATAKALETQAQAMGERAAFFRTQELPESHATGTASATAKAAPRPQAGCRKAACRDGQSRPGAHAPAAPSARCSPRSPPRSSRTSSPTGRSFKQRERRSVFRHHQIRRLRRSLSPGRPAWPARFAIPAPRAFF